MRGKAIPLAAAALIALAAAWYLGSPWWTLWRMREAARAGDLAKLAAYVDRPAIEAQAKAGLKLGWSSLAAAARGDRDERRHLLDLAGRELFKASRSGLRPENMRAWLAGTPILGGGDGDPYVVHQGLDRFEVRYRGYNLERGPLLTFRRHGLGWRLAGLRWGRQ